MITSSQSLLMATPSSSFKYGKFNPISPTCRCSSKTLHRPSTHLNFKRIRFLQLNNGQFGIKFNPLKIFTNIPVARADANHHIEDEKPVEVNEDHGTTEPDSDLVQQQKGNQLAKRVVFGLGIGISAGGVVLAGGWVFSVALAAAVFAGSREYFELVRSRGIASGMTPPPRYVSRVCSVICALMPLFTLDEGVFEGSVELITTRETQVACDTSYIEAMPELDEMYYPSYDTQIPCDADYTVAIPKPDEMNYQSYDTTVMEDQNHQCFMNSFILG